MFLMKLSFDLKGIYLINFGSSFVIVKNVKKKFLCDFSQVRQGHAPDCRVWQFSKRSRVRRRHKS